MWPIKKRSATIVNYGKCTTFFHVWIYPNEKRQSFPCVNDMKLNENLELLEVMHKFIWTKQTSVRPTLLATASSYFVPISQPHLSINSSTDSCRQKVQLCHNSYCRIPSSCAGLLSYSIKQGCTWIVSLFSLPLLNHSTTPRITITGRVRCAEPSWVIWVRNECWWCTISVWSTFLRQYANYRWWNLKTCCHFYHQTQLNWCDCFGRTSAQRPGVHRQVTTTSQASASWQWSSTWRWTNGQGCSSWAEEGGTHQNWYHFFSLYFIASKCALYANCSASFRMCSVRSSNWPSFSPRSTAAWNIKQRL